jgi:hypothetical protein
MPFAIDLARCCRAAVLCGGVWLAGCAVPPPAPPPPPPQPEQPPPPPPAPAPAPPAAQPADLATRQVLGAYERLRGLPPAELAREQARLGDGSAGPQAALELALVLVLPPSHTPTDTARALALVDGVLRNPAPDAAAWQPVARLLQGRLQEQRRLEDVIERQNQQARETQRRIDQLNDKLEALKAIERSLVTRPPLTGPASAPANGASRAPGS